MPAWTALPTAAALLPSSRESFAARQELAGLGEVGSGFRQAGVFGLGA